MEEGRSGTYLNNIPTARTRWGLSLLALHLTTVYR